MSRDDEATADELAVEYLAAAGYAPDAMRTALVALDRLRHVVELEAEAARAVAAASAEPAGPGEVVVVGSVADAVSGAAAYVDPALERIVDARRAYPPHVDPDDTSHPAIEVRVARVMRLAAGRDGERGEERYRAHVTGVVVGNDPRRVKLDGARWSSARLGLVADLPADWETDEDGPRVTLRGQKHEATLWPVGRAWGDLSVDELRPRRRARVAGYPAVIGVKPVKRDATAPHEPRLDGNGPRPATGAAVAVIYVGARALLVYVDGADAEAKLATILRGMRVMTAEEHAAIRAPRLSWRPAPRATTVRTVRELVPELCGSPDLARWLSDQSRRASVGDPIKCVD
jgi:predicted Zn-dependent protease